ncbi:MAG: hypothetical protein U0800_20460 [Isosphaeraceae bacterium]
MSQAVRSGNGPAEPGCRTSRVPGVDRLVYAQQRGQQELLVVGDVLPGASPESLQAVVERIPLGMAAGVLLDPLQWFEPHPVDGEPIHMIGHLQGFFLVAFVPGYRWLGTRPYQLEHLLADLGIAGQIAGPNRLAQDRGGLRRLAA